MLDIRKIKENPDAIKAGLKAKEVDCDAVIDRILELDVQIRSLKTTSEARTAEKNKINKENGKLYGMKKGLEKKGQDTAEVDAKIAANTCAAIKIHPNGKILYGSNRGHDSLITCRIKEDGLLEKLSIQPVYGHFPRDFDIDSTGKWLIAGGQYTDNLVVFSINEEDGALTKVHEYTGVDAVTGVLLTDFE